MFRIQLRTLHDQLVQQVTSLYVYCTYNRLHRAYGMTRTSGRAFFFFFFILHIRFEENAFSNHYIIISSKFTSRLTEGSRRAHNVSTSYYASSSQNIYYHRHGIVTWCRDIVYIAYFICVAEVYSNIRDRHPVVFRFVLLRRIQLTQDYQNQKIKFLRSFDFKTESAPKRLVVKL